MNLQNIVADAVEAVFQGLKLDVVPLVHPSDRPDIGDFQCDNALSLAKTLHQAPRDIAIKIAGDLQKNPLFQKVSVDGPGFINMTLDNQFLTDKAFEIIGSEKSGFEGHTPLKIVLDYCGPNLGKVLHVGHLRPAVIGEAIKRLMTFAGDEVIGDTHLGDWGRPMGLIITEIQARYPDLPCFAPDWDGGDFDLPITQKDLENMYPVASQKSKEDDTYLAKAKTNTRLLQEGSKMHRALWKKFTLISIDSVKKIYDRLGIQPTVWYGESRVHNRCLDLIERLKSTGLLVQDDGAWIIPLGTSVTGKELPPFMAVNSEQAVMYAMTDLATIHERLEEFKPDKILYCADLRQALHFEQVFLTAQKTGIAPDTGLEFLGFGTINGKDNKPYKTRDGGVMPLENLIDLGVNKIFERIQEGLIGRDLSGDEQKQVSEMVGLSAIKFADLMNDRKKNYIFDEEALTSTEGRTGPYILYALVRLRAILEKMGISANLTPNDVPGTSTEIERQILLTLYGFPGALQNAYDARAPHVLCDYLFKLAQQANTFYHDCPIKEAEKLVQTQRVALIKYILYVAGHITHILGLQVPEHM